MPKGHEDHLIAEWFLKAGWRDSLARWISDGEFIDYPRKGGKWANPYTPHTRAIHQLKGRDEFIEAVKWFTDESSRHKMDSELTSNGLEFPDEKVTTPFIHYGINPQIQKWPDHLQETWNRGQTASIKWVDWG